jgi:endonuclease-3 related protein
VKPQNLFNELRDAHGPFETAWWPAATQWEVFVGAMLVQNTAWTHAEKAIVNLKKEKLLQGNNPHAIAQAPRAKLEQAIKPAGFYKTKAARLKKMAKHFSRYHTLDDFFNKPLKEAREELLSLKGVGPETADSILLYAGGKHSFVIDAYTKRLVQRIGGQEFDTYDDAKNYFENSLPKSPRLFNEFHALIVEHSKKYCKKEPACATCPLRARCEHFKTTKHAQQQKATNKKTREMKTRK